MIRGERGANFGFKNVFKGQIKGDNKPGQEKTGPCPINLPDSSALQIRRIPNPIDTENDAAK